MSNGLLVGDRGTVAYYGRLSTNSQASWIPMVSFGFEVKLVDDRKTESNTDTISQKEQPIS